MGMKLYERTMKKRMKKLFMIRMKSLDLKMGIIIIKVKKFRQNRKFGMQLKQKITKII
jgi:hypothetical protein